MEKIQTPLRRLMREAGITQRDMAKRVGVSVAAINFACKGNVSDHILRKIADELGVSPEKLRKPPIQEQ